jgi:hypothetical protein
LENEIKRSNGTKVHSCFRDSKIKYKCAGKKERGRQIKKKIKELGLKVCGFMAENL